MAYPVPGTVWLNPTAADAGGTRLLDIVEDEIEYEQGKASIEGRSDFDRGSYVLLRDTAPDRLILPLVGNAEALAMLLGDTEEFDLEPVFSIAVRPKDSTEKHLYGPHWQLSAESEARLVFSRRRWLFEDSRLILVAGVVPGAAKKPSMYDTVANINTHYGL